MNHAYPQQLAAYVYKLWNSVKASPSDGEGAYSAGRFDVLPTLPLLESLLSICYQASLLREEERQVTFRILVGSSDLFSSEDGPPNGLHRLNFTELIPLTAHELRRLSPGASFHRSLIGVSLERNEGPQIWGILHSGPRWLHSMHGGRGFVPPLPPALVINVTGPGHLEVCKGLATVGQLSEGRVIGSAMNVFESIWLQEFFAAIRAERLALHAEASKKATGWATLDPDFSRIVDQNMLKRMIAAIRAFNHGGTLIIVPPERASQVFEKNSFLSLRYKFTEGECRARFRTLIVAVMNALARSGVGLKDGRVIGWRDYAESTDLSIAQLDEAIFEMSHLVAAQSTIDGAVVMTKRFELLGFGAEIQSDLTTVSRVARALDLEGRCKLLESVNGVGTRHRSAYALCHDLKDVLVIVISQDGGVRFINWRDDVVTYWDHQATFAFTARL
ncbi:MAG: diadenylate cyclase [Candidatus Obscuribacterales bacterium]|nr:diadenylate cyclase [Candidatus Obscuribacterales bacterium]